MANHVDCKVCGDPIVFLMDSRNRFKIPVDADTATVGDYHFTPAAGHERHVCPNTDTTTHDFDEVVLDVG